MPSMLPRPASQPKPAFERVQVVPRQKRNSAFRPHQSLIEKLYIQDGKELKWIMRFMNDEFGLDLSVKQYKSQFKNWGLRHNLTQRDAAFILRLFNQARKEGREEFVIFSGQPRRRDDILKYIKRNEKIIDEDDLLSCISDDEETPQHIKLQDSRVQPSPPTASQFPPTPPSASPSGSLDRQVIHRDISPMRVPIPSPEHTPQYTPTPRHSGEWTEAELAAVATSGGEAAPGLFHHVYDRLQAHNSASQSQLAMPDTRDPFLSSHAQFRPGRSQSYHNNHTSKESSADLTHAAMSSTAAKIGKFSVLDLDRILGEQIHSPQLKDGSLSAYFVMYCLYWLLCVGQDDATFQSNGECYLNSALTAFLCMLTSANSPAEECLGALSVLAALFECYGQRERLGELLMRCDELTKKHYGWENPLTMTIEFMGNMLAGSGCNPHNIHRLQQVMSDMRVIFFQSPRPALTARYHLAWARLENELKKEVRRPEDLELVRQELVDLTKQCELHFGEGRIETIMAAATLARTTLWCGDGREAERILSRSVMPRVRGNFVESHPYVWEAKHRHAFFLFQLASKESDATKFAHLQLGEQLLREIVPARWRILGDKNPKTKHSFCLLRDTLIAQGREPEASTLQNWCERESYQSSTH